VQFIDTTDSLFGKFGRVTALRRNRVRIEVYRATIRPENIVFRTEQQLQFTESSDLFRIVPPGNGEDDWASERSIKDDDWNSVRSESSRYKKKKKKITTTTTKPLQAVPRCLKERKGKG
jgi:hypothetical protein